MTEMDLAVLTAHRRRPGRRESPQDRSRPAEAASWWMTSKLVRAAF